MTSKPGWNPNLFYREDCPCEGCTEKFIGCHGRCPKDARGEYGYNAWRARIEEIKKNRKAYDDLNRRKSCQR